MKTPKTMKPILALAAVSSLALVPGQAAMMLDFNSTNKDGGPHPEAGYLSYDAGHEVAADFVAKSYPVTFANSGAATVTVTPAWPNTTDRRVRQMLDRPGNRDNTWQGNNIDLLTDWLGTDSRTNSGGKGTYDGTNGTPTYLTIALSGLPAGTYSWTSFHHDTEMMTADFYFEVSTDSGANYSMIGTYTMTHSTHEDGSTPETTNALNGDPHNLSSTVTTTFDANGIDDVVIRLTPLGHTGNYGHAMFVGINGFELDQVPEPSSSPLMLLVGGMFFGLRRRR